MLQARLAEQALRALGAVEQPDRLVEQAAERHQIFRRAFVGLAHAVGAGLDEGEIDPRVGGLQ